MTIRTFSFDADRGLPIARFASVGASSVELAHGRGEAHANAIHFEPGGSIGPHPAGFDQLFLVVQGSGWVAGADGVRIAVEQARGAFIPNCEVHSKGSEGGMIAVMIQTSEFALAVTD